MRRRYLAHAILHNGQVCRTSVAGIDACGGVSVEKFDGETPGTIFVSGIVCVCRADRLTEFDRKTLARIVQTSNLVESAIRRAKEYMSDKGLYMNSCTTESAPLLLPLDRK